MSPQKSPSPDKQDLLYSSHLKGMERPVRSFESFIRATPPRASPDKPLPPIPPRPQPLKTPSSSSSTTVRTRNTGFSLWEAPSNWGNGANSQALSTPPFAIRHCSPLIPESPEDIAAMQVDTILWQQGNGPFQQTSLDPIHELTAITPDIPPRNPSRLSLSVSKPSSTKERSKDTLPSVSSRYSTGTHDEYLSENVSEPASGEQSNTDLPSPLDLVPALSDMTIKEKAFNSLGLGSSRDQGIVWRGQPRRTNSLQLDDDAQLDLQGNKLITFRKRCVLADDSSVSPDDPEVRDKIQALSFTQDYHNILADQYIDDLAQPERHTPPKTPPKDRDLAPRPLAWRKESDNSPPAEPSQRPPLVPSSSSGQRQKLGKMSSWVSHHLGKDSQPGVPQKSASTPEVPSQKRPADSEVDRHLKKDALLANIVQHGKDLVSHKILRRGSEPKKPLVISSPLPQHSAQAPENLTVSAAPFELATPLFRLPGGLVIVRQSPLSTPQPQATGDSPTSPFSDLSWPDFSVSSPFRFDFSRRSSWQSSKSQPQVAVTAALKQKQSSPLGSPSFLRSFSYSTTSLVTPVPQEASSPYSPPQSRRRSHNVGSPLTAPPSSHGIEQRADHYTEEPPHKLNLFEKAKHARDAWKMHQREVKNEKLKQSIRLIGPADARDVAGYIECHRVSGDSGIGEGRLEGCMSKETT